MFKDLNNLPYGLMISVMKLSNLLINSVFDDKLQYYDEWKIQEIGPSCYDGLIQH